MLKHWGKIALICIAALALLFAASFFFPAKYQICGADEYTHARECAEHHAGSFALLWITSVVDHFNGLVTAIATVVMAIFTGTLWLVTNRSVSLAREEFIASHRSRIILREVDIIDGRIHYILVNLGTEATLVESWIMMETTPVHAQIPRNLRSFGHDDLGPLVFGHGEMKDLTIEEGEAGFFIRFPDARRLRTEKREPVGDVYFVGSLRYQDAVGTLRRSVFRRRWNFEIERFERTGDDYEYAD
jgi:hypothetical protein